VRELLAFAIAMGTGLLIVAAIVTFAFVRHRRIPPETPPAAEETSPADRTEPPATPQVSDPSHEFRWETGKRVYREQRCSRCHSIAGEGSPRYPLDGVGSRLTAEVLRIWIVAPQTLRPGIRKPSYDDLPAEELDALVDYLQSLTLPDVETDA